MRNSLTLLMIL